MNLRTLTKLSVKRPESKRKVISLLLSGVFFFTNVLAPYAAENDFWAERQKAVQKMKQESDLLGNLASVSLQTPKQPVSHLNQEQYQLLAQLPHVTKLDLGVSKNINTTSTNIPSFSKGVVAQFIERRLKTPDKSGNYKEPNEPNGLNGRLSSPSWLSAILPYGSIGDIYISKSPAAPLVIHIQDVHGILEAQKNIASIIQSVVAQFTRGELAESVERRSIDRSSTTPDKSGNYNEPNKRNNSPVVVGLEGAAGGFTIHPYRNFPDAEVTKDIAEYFLKEGYIGGPEFAALTAPEAPFLWGVEDLPLYEKNIQTIYNSQKNKPQFQAILNEYKKAATNLKENVYSKELKEFDKQYTAYRNAEGKLGDYVRYLMMKEVRMIGSRRLQPAHIEERRINPAATDSPSRKYVFPNLHLLLQALNLEETLDFKVVEQERIQLIETLVKKLTQEQLTELVQESINYKLGHLNYSEYHQYLKQLCKNNRIPIQNFTKLDSYINYVGLAERINRNKLLDELTNLEEQIQTSLAVTQEQKSLVSANKSLIMLEKLANHNMTTDDWKQYESLSSLSSLRFLSQKNQRLNEPNELDGLKELLMPFEDFCRYATQRNNALVENLLTENNAGSVGLYARKEEYIKNAHKGLHYHTPHIGHEPNERTLTPSPLPLGERVGVRGDVAVLVAGGFHTSGLTQILRQKDISYVVVTPKITEVPKEDHYLDVFARKPLPLEKLFSGEKISLKSPLLIAKQVPNGYEDWDLSDKTNQLKSLFSTIQTFSLLDKIVQGKESEENLQKAIEMLKQRVNTIGLDLELEPDDVKTVLGTTRVNSTKITGENYTVQVGGAVTDGNETERDAIAKYIEDKNNKYIGAINIGGRWFLFFGINRRSNPIREATNDIAASLQGIYETGSKVFPEVFSTAQSSSKGLLPWLKGPILSVLNQFGKPISWIGLKKGYAIYRKAMEIGYNNFLGPVIEELGMAAILWQFGITWFVGARILFIFGHLQLRGPPFGDQFIIPFRISVISLLALAAILLPQVSTFVPVDQLITHLYSVPWFDILVSKIGEKYAAIAALSTFGHVILNILDSRDLSAFNIIGKMNSFQAAMLVLKAQDTARTLTTQIGEVKPGIQQYWDMRKGYIRTMSSIEAYISQMRNRNVASGHFAFHQFNLMLGSEKAVGLARQQLKKLLKIDGKISPSRERGGYTWAVHTSIGGIVYNYGVADKLGFFFSIEALMHNMAFRNPLANGELTKDWGLRGRKLNSGVAPNELDVIRLGIILVPKYMEGYKISRQLQKRGARIFFYEKDSKGEYRLENGLLQLLQKIEPGVKSISEYSSKVRNNKIKLDSGIEPAYIPDLHADKGVADFGEGVYYTVRRYSKFWAKLGKKAGKSLYAAQSYLSWRFHGNVEEQNKIKQHVIQEYESLVKNIIYHTLPVIFKELGIRKKFKIANQGSTARNTFADDTADIDILVTVKNKRARKKLIAEIKSGGFKSKLMKHIVNGYEITGAGHNPNKAGYLFKAEIKHGNTRINLDITVSGEENHYLAMYSKQQRGIDEQMSWEKAGSSKVSRHPMKIIEEEISLLKLLFKKMHNKYNFPYKFYEGGIGGIGIEQLIMQSSLTKHYGTEIIEPGNIERLMLWIYTGKKSATPTKLPILYKPPRRIKLYLPTSKRTLLSRLWPWLPLHRRYVFENIIKKLSKENYEKLWHVAKRYVELMKSKGVWGANLEELLSGIPSSAIPSTNKTPQRHTAGPSTPTQQPRPESPVTPTQTQPAHASPKSGLVAIDISEKSPKKKNTVAIRLERPKPFSLIGHGVATLAFAGVVYLFASLFGIDLSALGSWETPAAFLLYGSLSILTAYSGLGVFVTGAHGAIGLILRIMAHWFTQASPKGYELDVTSETPIPEWVDKEAWDILQRWQVSASAKIRLSKSSGFGRLAETAKDGTVTIVPWLLAKSESGKFNKMRQYLLPIVLAHEGERLYLYRFSTSLSHRSPRLSRALNAIQTPIIYLAKPVAVPLAILSNFIHSPFKNRNLITLTQKRHKAKPEGYMDIDDQEKNLPVVKKLVRLLTDKKRIPFKIIGGGGSGKTEALKTALHLAEKEDKLFDLRGWTLEQLGNEEIISQLASETENSTVIREFQERFEGFKKEVAPKVQKEVQSLITKGKIAELDKETEFNKRLKETALKDMYLKDKTLSIKKLERLLLKRYGEAILNELQTSEADVIWFDEFDMGILPELQDVEREIAGILMKNASRLSGKQIGVIIHPPAAQDEKFMAIVNDILGEDAEEVDMEYLPRSIEESVLRKVGLERHIAEELMDEIQGLPSAYLGIVTEIETHSEYLNILKEHGEQVLAAAIRKNVKEKLVKLKSVIIDRADEDVKNMIMQAAFGVNFPKNLDEETVKKLKRTIFVKVNEDGSLQMSPIVREALTEALFDAKRPAADIQRDLRSIFPDANITLDMENKYFYANREKLNGAEKKLFLAIYNYIKTRKETESRIIRVQDTEWGHEAMARGNIINSESPEQMQSKLYHDLASLKESGQEFLAAEEKTQIFEAFIKKLRENKLFHIDHHYPIKALATVSTTVLIVDFLLYLYDTGQNGLISELQNSFGLVDHSDADSLLSHFVLKHASDMAFLRQYGSLLKDTALLNDYLVERGDAINRAKVAILYDLLLSLETKVKKGEITFDEALLDIKDMVVFATKYSVRYDEEGFYRKLSIETGEFNGGDGIVENNETHLARRFHKEARAYIMERAHLQRMLAKFAPSAHDDIAPGRIHLLGFILFVYLADEDPPIANSTVYRYLRSQRPDLLVGVNAIVTSYNDGGRVAKIRSVFKDNGYFLDLSPVIKDIKKHYPHAGGRSLAGSLGVAPVPHADDEWVKKAILSIKQAIDRRVQTKKESFNVSSSNILKSIVLSLIFTFMAPAIVYAQNLFGIALVGNINLSIPFQPLLLIISAVLPLGLLTVSLYLEEETEEISGESEAETEADDFVRKLYAFELRNSFGPMDESELTPFIEFYAQVFRQIGSSKIINSYKDALQKYGERDAGAIFKEILPNVMYTVKTPADFEHIYEILLHFSDVVGKERFRYKFPMDKIKNLINSPIDFELLIYAFIRIIKSENDPATGEYKAKDLINMLEEIADLYGSEHQKAKEFLGIIAELKVVYGLDKVVHNSYDVEKLTKNSLAPYVSDKTAIDFLKIRGMLALREYEELKELNLPAETIVKAFLMNNQKSIYIQRDNMILDYQDVGYDPHSNKVTDKSDEENNKGIGIVLKHMKPVEWVTKPVTQNDLETVFEQLGLRSYKNKPDLETLLRQEGYGFFDHKGETFIIPLVHDNVLSGYRGSKENDHLSATSLTQSLLYALDYVNMGGELTTRGGGSYAAFGDNALHEFDMGLLLLIGFEWDEKYKNIVRGGDGFIPLAFNHISPSIPGQFVPLPEYARKRTLVINDVATIRDIKRLSNFQTNERRAKQIMHKVFTSLINGELRNGTDLIQALHILEKQLEILKTQTGLKNEYFQAVFGHLDFDEKKEFVKESKFADALLKKFQDHQYKPGYDNRKILTSLLHELMKNSKVIKTFKREYKDNNIIQEKVEGSHPWLANNKTIIDYLAMENAVRSKIPFDNKNLSHDVTLETMSSRGGVTTPPVSQKPFSLIWHGIAALSFAGASYLFVSLFGVDLSSLGSLETPATLLLYGLLSVLTAYSILGVFVTGVPDAVGLILRILAPWLTQAPPKGYELEVTPKLPVPDWVDKEAWDVLQGWQQSTTNAKVRLFQPSGFGRLAETKDGMVTISPWLLAKSENGKFNKMRQYLLPIVLAHEGERLQNHKTLRIYLAKPLTIPSLIYQLLASLSQTQKTVRRVKDEVEDVRAPAKVSSTEGIEDVVQRKIPSSVVKSKNLESRLPDVIQTVSENPISSEQEMQAWLQRLYKDPQNIGKVYLKYINVSGERREGYIQKDNNPYLLRLYDGSLDYIRAIVFRTLEIVYESQETGTVIVQQNYVPGWLATQNTLRLEGLISSQQVKLREDIVSSHVESLRSHVYPISVQILSDGSIVVGDYSELAYGAVIYKSDGTTVPLLDESGRYLIYQSAGEIVKQVTVDNSDNIYVVTTRGKIRKYSNNGELLGSYDIDLTDESFQPITRNSVAVNVQGMIAYKNKLYFTIVETGELRILDLMTGKEKIVSSFKETVKTGSFKGWVSTGSMGLGIDRKSGIIYIVDAGYTAAFGSAPTRIRMFDVGTEEYSEPREIPGLFSTGGVAIDSHGTVYVSDRDRMVIHVGKAGEGYIGYFHTPGGVGVTSIDVDSEDNVVVGRQGGFDLISKDAIQRMLIQPSKNNIGENILQLRSLPKLNKPDSDKNIGSGTMDEANHEAFNKQLQTQFNKLIEAYNRQVPDWAKEIAGRHFGLIAREKIPVTGDSKLREIETDLSLVFLGLLSQHELVMLQKLRQIIRSTKEYHKAKGKTMKEIEIFFVPPQTGAELFWHGEDYAAGHYNRSGTRIYISFPLALTDAHELVLARARPAPYRILSVEVAQHELIHISEGHHDASLDETMREIATRDSARSRIKYPIVKLFNLAGNIRLEISSIVTYARPIETLAMLHEITTAGGWHSIAVPTGNLPKDLLDMFERVKIEDFFGNKISMFDILKMTTDEVIFAPHTMAYSQWGEKMMYSVGNLIPQPFKLHDDILRPGKRIIVVGTLIPSDAIKTGERIYTRNIYELSRYIIRALGERAVQQMVEDEKISHEYLTDPRLRERNGWALERQFLNAFSDYLLKTRSGDATVQELVKFDLRGQFLAEVESKIRHLNSELQIPESYLDIPPDILNKIASYKSAQGGTEHEPKPFSLWHHGVATMLFGAAAILAGSYFGFDPSVLWDWRGWGKFVTDFFLPVYSGVGFLAVGLSGVGAYLARRHFAPRVPTDAIPAAGLPVTLGMEKPGWVDQDAWDILQSKVQKWQEWQELNPQITVKLGYPDKGYVAQTKGLEVTLSPWLVAKSDDAKFNRRRQTLLPMVLSHEGWRLSLGRLGITSNLLQTPIIYLAKPFTVLYLLIQAIEWDKRINIPEPQGIHDDGGSSLHMRETIHSMIPKYAYVPETHKVLRTASKQKNASLGMSNSMERVKLIFERVKQSTNEDISISDRVLDGYAKALHGGKRNEIEIYAEILQTVRSQRYILSHQVGPTLAQQLLVTDANSTLQNYIESLGLTYHRLNVAFAPSYLFPPDKGGVYFEYYRTMVLPSDIKEGVLRTALLHEGLHRNSYGFAQTKLNEGMTEYLLVKLLMTKEGYEDFSYESVLIFCRDRVVMNYSEGTKLEHIGYLYELAAILRLVEVVGERALSEAYFRGDQSQLQALLVSDWEIIIRLAELYENVDDIQNKSKYMQSVALVLAGKNPSLGGAASVLDSMVKKSKFVNERPWVYWLYTVLGAAVWEEWLFRNIALGHTGTTWQSILALDPTGLGVALGISVIAFSFAHILVRWLVRAHDNGWNQWYMPWRYAERQDLEGFFYLIPAAIFSLVYILAAGSFLPIISNHALTASIIAHATWNALALRFGWLVASVGEQSKSDRDFKKNFGQATQASAKHPEHNEDASFVEVLPDGVRVAAVFDGIGGHTKGEAASRIARDVVQTTLKNIRKEQSENEILEQLIAAMKETAMAMNRELSGTRAGTTATVAVMVSQDDANTRIFIANAGDSRAYILKPKYDEDDNNFEVLTVDNIKPEEGQEYMIMTIEDVRDHLKKTKQPFFSSVWRREQITDWREFQDERRRVHNVLIEGHEYKPALTVVTVPSSSRLVLTSDGIHDNLSDGEMFKYYLGYRAKELGVDQSAQDLAQLLVDGAVMRANERDIRSKPDDMTAIVITLGEVPAPESPAVQVEERTPVHKDINDVKTFEELSDYIRDTAGDRGAIDPETGFMIVPVNVSKDKPKQRKYIEGDEFVPIEGLHKKVKELQQKGPKSGAPSRNGWVDFDPIFKALDVSLEAHRKVIKAVIGTLQKERVISEVQAKDVLRIVDSNGDWIAGLAGAPILLSWEAQRLVFNAVFGPRNVKTLEDIGKIKDIVVPANQTEFKEVVEKVIKEVKEKYEKGEVIDIQIIRGPPSVKPKGLFSKLFSHTPETPANLMKAIEHFKTKPPIFWTTDGKIMIHEDVLKSWNKGKDPDNFIQELTETIRHEQSEYWRYKQAKEAGLNINTDMLRDWHNKVVNRPFRVADEEIKEDQVLKETKTIGGERRGGTVFVRLDNPVELTLTPGGTKEQGGSLALRVNLEGNRGKILFPQDVFPSGREIYLEPGATYDVGRNHQVPAGYTGVSSNHLELTLLKDLKTGEYILKIVDTKSSFGTRVVLARSKKTEIDNVEAPKQEIIINGVKAQLLSREDLEIFLNNPMINMNGMFLVSQLIRKNQTDAIIAIHMPESDVREALADGRIKAIEFNGIKQLVQTLNPEKEAAKLTDEEETEFQRYVDLMIISQAGDTYYVNTIWSPKHLGVFNAGIRESFAGKKDALEKAREVFNENSGAVTDQAAEPEIPNVRAEVASRRASTERSEENNEDAVYVDEQHRIILVADGMGGHNAGKEASHIAKDVISKHVTENLSNAKSVKDVIDILKESLSKAHDAILNYVNDHPEARGMGTTLSLVVLWKDNEGWRIVGINIGDSRIYVRHPDGSIIQISKDDSPVQQLVDVKAITPEQAEIHYARNQISKALGHHWEIEEHNIFDKSIGVNDIVFAISDGVSDNLGQEGVKDAAGQYNRPYDLVQALVNEAVKVVKGERPTKAEPKDDDITAAAIRPEVKAQKVSLLGLQIAGWIGIAATAGVVVTATVFSLPYLLVGSLLMVPAGWKFLNLLHKVRTRSPPNAQTRNARLQAFREVAAHLGIEVNEELSRTDDLMEADANTLHSSGKKILKINPSNIALLTMEEAVELLKYHEQVHFGRFQKIGWFRLNELPAYVKFGLVAPYARLLRATTNGVRNAWRNWQVKMEWAREAVQEGIPNVVDAKLIKTREQKDDIEDMEELLRQHLLGGQAASVEWSRFKLQFDVVRRDFGISSVPSQVTREQMNQWYGFVKGGIKVLGRSIGIVSRFRNRKVLKEMLTSETGFARAMIRAKGDNKRSERFRKLVARDILKKAQRLSTLGDSSALPQNDKEKKSQNDRMALYKEIMREVALLRAADSSLFWELGKEKDKKVKLRKYQQHDIDFLIQMPVFVGLSGLYERQSDEHAESKLDLAFNRFYDGTLRQAVLFDAVEQIITGEGKKTDGNLMGIDVSELFNTDETKVTKEHREFMVMLLTYLAAKLAESPESIAKQIVLMSNNEGISDKDLLQKLARIYPESVAVWNTLKNMDEKVMVRTTHDHNELRSEENKISMGGLVSMLKNQGHNVSALEVFGLRPEEHLDFSGINREKISLRIIDLVTNATVEIQEEMKKTRFVAIQA